MNNLDNVTRLKHLDALASSAALADAMIRSSFQNSLASAVNQFNTGLAQVVAGDVFVIGSVSSSIEGAFWLED